MPVQIKLIHNKGFHWYCEGNQYVIGYAFNEKNDYLEGKSLKEHIQKKIFNGECASPQELGKVNGVFSYIYSGDQVYLYSDKTRFFPLFYLQHADYIGISDEPTILLDNDSKIDAISEKEFKLTGFVSGEHTLINNIKQVCPGELVTFKENANFTNKNNLFSYQVKSNDLIDTENIIEIMKVQLNTAFLRMAKSLEGSTPILPLSGGFDSRLIACKLKEHGFDNTICFTYGRYTSETEISKKVAEKLGFIWYFIDYSHVDEDILNSSSFNEYYKYSSRCTSMFYLQEYYACLYLKSKCIVPKNSVFIPGHSGDLLGGSQFIKTFKINIQPSEIKKTIIDSKCIYYPINKGTKATISERFEDQVDTSGKYLPYSTMEDWDIKNKIAKFIFNSSNVFTFFNFEVRFPFWDNELVEFFRRVPPKEKLYKTAYDKCLQKHFFSKYNVNFNEELSPKAYHIFIQNIKSSIKKLFPKFIRQKYVDKNDWACYKNFTESMRQEVNNKKLPYTSYNSVLINWYLKKVREMIFNWRF